MPRDYHTAKQIVFDAMPGTQNEIVERTGLNRTTVGRWISVLRLDRQSHIGKWRRPKTTGPFLPVHHAGPGKDAPCKLKPLSRKAKWKKYTARLRREGSDELARKSRTYYWRHKAETKGDPLVHALFGIAA